MTATNFRQLFVPAFLAVVVITANSAHAQSLRQLVPREEITKEDTTGDEEDLMTLLEDSEPAQAQKEYVSATFKSTRLMNGHSVETVGSGVLDFRISHRFNNLNSGIGEFFGLDGSTIRLGFDYGITRWLMIGVGRSSFEKEYDGLIKARLFRQAKGGGLPFSLTWLASGMIKSIALEAPAGQEYYLTNRLAYASQLIIARKFSEKFSLQLMPTYVHYNLVKLRTDPNDVFALGIGGRLKLSHRISLNGEWYYRLPDSRFDNTYNSLAIGFDIETGGHVFQVHFTNSTGMTERTFVGQTAGNWADGDVRFGFNISRVFTITRPKEFKNSRNKIY